ncbi:MAG TPA: MucB/RseB C-terminal domain-containing protein [Burkholderiaceae bacterium]|jgi:sigma-E factor negative regulatory protein RseB
MGQTFVLFRFVVFVLLNLIAIIANAENGKSPSDIKDAQNWLMKIQSAAQRLNYSGTFVYQQGNQFRTSKITHIAEGKNEIEKLEVLDGKQREYIRNNEEITCYVPETKTLLVEKRLTQDVFPAILSANSSALTEYYHVKKGETGRIAGYDCQSIDLTPNDNLRYGYKLWAEKSTGLLLRTQTLNEKNEVIEQISFTQIQIGGIHPAQVKPSFSNTSGWQVENQVMKQISSSGLRVNGLPPGFKKIRELKRTILDTSKQNAGMVGTQSNNSLSNQHEVSQIVFSDGLAAISVFVEPSSQSRTEGSLQQGAMNITGKRQGDFWITIVGEVPPSAIKNVANSIEFQPK